MGLTAELPVYQLGTIAKSRSSLWIAKSRCMRDKGIDGRNVHEVVLVGRSIRIPGAQAASGVRQRQVYLTRLSCRNILIYAMTGRTFDVSLFKV